MGKSAAATGLVLTVPRSRQSGRPAVGSRYRDARVRMAKGRQRMRQEKFFPDRVLLDNGKPAILPAVQ